MHEWRCKNESALQFRELRIAKHPHGFGSVLEARTIPDRTRPDERIVIARQDECGKTAEVGKEAYRLLHDGIINLVILKQVAGDYKRINLAVACNFKRTT